MRSTSKQMLWCKYAYLGTSFCDCSLFWIYIYGRSYIRRVFYKTWVNLYNCAHYGTKRQQHKDQTATRYINIAEANRLSLQSMMGNGIMSDRIKYISVYHVSSVKERCKHVLCICCNLRIFIVSPTFPNTKYIDFAYILAKGYNFVHHHSAAFLLPWTLTF